MRHLHNATEAPELLPRWQELPKARTAVQIPDYRDDLVREAFLGKRDCCSPKLHIDGTRPYYGPTSAQSH